MPQLPTLYYRNLMKIVLEKDIKSSFSVSDLEGARVLGKLGVDLMPGAHTLTGTFYPMGKI